MHSVTILCLAAMLLAAAPASPASHPMSGASAGDSTACAGLLDLLEDHFSQGRKVWFADPWEYSYMEMAPWSRASGDWPHDPLRYVAPAPTDSSEQDWVFADPCSTAVDRHFYLGRDTLSVTYGRIPEACSEAPALLWRDSAGRSFRRAIPPLFNWNIAAMWCTEHYLVFGMEAAYEGGGYAESLALWDLPSGNLEFAFAPAWTRGDTLDTRPVVLLQEDFPSWRKARLAEAESCLVLRGEEKALVIWPERRQVAVFDARSGR